MAGCKVLGCTRGARTRGLCNMHYQRQWKHGDALARKCRANGEGSLNQVGHRIVTRKGRRAAEHILVCEKALGHRLPRGAQVFHVDADVENNARGNLVICGTHAFHAFLMIRGRAYDATGNPDLRQCCHCKRWDEPGNLYFRKGMHTGAHRSCRQAARQTPLGVVLAALMRPSGVAAPSLRWINPKY